MNITAWKNFSKRINSTKQPVTQGTALSCTLKTRTSIENPVFVLSGNNFDYNYIQALGHYYFVDNITSVANGIIEVSCKQDLLATYKSEIQNSTQYVEYASNGYDAFIPDTRIVKKSKTNKTEYIGDMSVFSSAGTYVLNVVSDKPGTSGFTTTYLMASADIRSLAQYLLSDLADPSLGAVVDWLQKSFFSTFGAIINCTWLPLSLSTCSAHATLEAVRIANDNVTPGGTQLTAYKVTNSSPIKIPNSFVTVPFTYINDFRVASPFTMAQLYIPFFGTMDLNPLDIKNGFSVDTYYDIITGDATTEIASSSKLISMVNYTIGVACPIAQTSTNISGGTTSIIGGTTGIVTALTSLSGGGAVAGAIAGAVANVNGAVELAKSTPSVKGSIQGRSMLDFYKFRLTITEVETSDIDNLTSLHGRPVMQVKSLLNLSGYVKTIGSSVDIAGFSNDKNEINKLLDNGVYIE